MVPLCSPEWGRFQHAYGAASDIPDLLKQLALSPGPSSICQDEPWYSLWSSLCHQGDVYSASYAAVPHIVQIGLATGGAIDTGFFLLPAWIEVARARKRGPEISAELEGAYADGLRNLHACAFRHSVDHWDVSMTQCVAAAIAAAKKQTGLAEALINLDSNLIAGLVSLHI